MDAGLGVLLKCHPMLSCLGIEDWRGVVAGVSPVELGRGGCLYRAGDPAGHLFLVAVGAVALRKPERSGEGLGPLGPGELVGTEALMAGACYGHSALVLAPLVAYPIPAARLVARLDDRFEAALAMIGVVAAALRLRVKEISELKLQSTSERLAGYLVELAPPRTGAAVLRLSCEKRELAERLGMDPATLSRAFAKLRSVGVDTDRSNRVTIADLDRLRYFAAADFPLLDEIA
jgi:CRP-like cAMP-binding protein